MHFGGLLMTLRTNPNLQCFMLACFLRPALFPTLSEAPSPSSPGAHSPSSTHWFTQSPVLSLVGVSAMLLLVVGLTVARTRRVVQRLQRGGMGTQPTDDGEQDGGDYNYHRLEGAPMELQAWELRQGAGLLY